MKQGMKVLRLVPPLLLTPLAVALVRTLRTPALHSEYQPHENEERAKFLAEKLSRMVQCDTTSHANAPEVEKFLAFHKTLEALFPLVHEKLERTVIDGNLL